MSRKRVTRRNRSVHGDERTIASKGREPEYAVISHISDERDMENYGIYMMGHQLMPDRYSYDPVDCGAIVASAIGMLRRPSSPNDHLWAIAVLGHSPCPEALKALSRYSEERGQLAGVAQMALSECSALFSQVPNRVLAG